MIDETEAEQSLYEAYMAAMRREVDIQFTYHPPRPDQVPLYEEMRDMAAEMMDWMIENVTASPELSNAISRLNEAVFWANAGIARRG